MTNSFFNKISILRLLLLVLFFNSSITLAGPSIAFVNPESQDNAFWNSVSLFMQAAADDLGIDLEVVYGNGDRFESFKQAKQILVRESPPDYLLFVYQASTGKRILDIAELKNVNTFIFNTDIHPRDVATVGKPREHYAYWLGHMHPNDYEAGKLLADTLIQHAKNNTKISRPIEMLGISGGLDSTPAGRRNEGLDIAVSKDDEVRLNQIVHTDWSTAQAFEKTAILLDRYPNTSVIWGASDSLAQAAIQAFKPGKEYITGGIDWTTKGLNSIKDGSLHASVGGHFMEGAWSLVMLYDHARGIDFNTDQRLILTEMNVIDASNVERYLDKIKAENYERINFSRFSKALNTELKGYDFSLEAVFDSLSKD